MKYQTFKNIAKAVSYIFQISEAQIYSKNSTSSVSDARFLLYYLCVQQKMKKVTIKEYMERNGYITGHSNIIYGLGVVEEKIKEDKDYSVVINKIQSNLADCIH